MSNTTLSQYSIILKLHFHIKKKKNQQSLVWANTVSYNSHIATNLYTFVIYRNQELK